MVRVIEPTESAYLDYLAAKARGVSSTIRPLAQFEIEPLVTNYNGPPAHIFWSRDFDDEELRGWAVPYETLDLRRASCAGVLGLETPGLTYTSFAQGIGSARSWMRGNVIGPAHSKFRLFENQPVETILTTPRFILNLTRFSITIPSLRNIVVFVGCEFIDLDQVNLLKTSFPNVNIVICYYRSWTGIISAINALGVTASHQVGIPVAGVQLTIRPRDGQIVVSGPHMDGVHMLAADGVTDYTGHWVPTRNIGSIEAGGGLIVSGYVA